MIYVLISVRNSGFHCLGCFESKIPLRVAMLSELFSHHFFVSSRTMVITGGLHPGSTANLFTKPVHRFVRVSVSILSIRKCQVLFAHGANGDPGRSYLPDPQKLANLCEKIRRRLECSQKFGHCPNR